MRGIKSDSKSNAESSCFMVPGGVGPRKGEFG